MSNKDIDCNLTRKSTRKLKKRVELVGTFYSNQIIISEEKQCNEILIFTTPSKAHEFSFICAQESSETLVETRVQYLTKVFYVNYRI